MIHLWTIFTQFFGPRTVSPETAVLKVTNGIMLNKNSKCHPAGVISVDNSMTCSGIWQ